MTKRKKIWILPLFVLVLYLTGCTPGGTGESESFEKYGQEFEGKIAKTYEESEEWWPSSPKPPQGTPNVADQYPEKLEELKARWSSVGTKKA